MVAWENPWPLARSDSPASENLWKSLGVFDQDSGPLCGIPGGSLEIKLSWLSLTPERLADGKLTDFS